MIITESPEIQTHYGWDAPLQYYFLTVWKNGVMIYSNLDDSQARAGTYSGGLTFEQLRKKLEQLGVDLTPGEWQHLEQHRPARTIKPGMRRFLDRL